VKGGRGDNAEITSNKEKTSTRWIKSQHQSVKESEDVRQAPQFKDFP
jgi:hypothetical protein